MKEKDCCCGGIRLIFPCSGSSDTGELTDRSARKLTLESWGRMYCLAGIGAHQKGFLESAEAADEIVAIDGCPSACASKVLEHAGFKPRKHNLRDSGLLKGHSPASDENIATVCAAVRKGK